jgi:hypothetical protein
MQKLKELLLNRTGRPNMEYRYIRVIYLGIKIL